MKFTYLFRSIYRPTSHTFVGLHSSTDPNFGSEYYADAFVGSGAKLKSFIKHIQNTQHLTPAQIRSNFTVEVILGGTYEQCKARYDMFVIPYDHPLCLNLKEGTAPGIPKTPEHIEAMSQALKEAMKGNDNVKGTVRVDEQGHTVTNEVKEVLLSQKKKTKWINDSITSKLVALPIDENENVIVPNGWSLGKAKVKLIEEDNHE